MILVGSNQLGFFIDGTHWPMHQQDFIHCKMQRGLGLALPQLELKFNNRINFLQENNITCGSRLSTVHYIDGKEKLYDWFITEYEYMSNKENTTIVYASLYKPKWLRGVAKPKYGTSLDAIRQLAMESDYKFLSNELFTDDEGLWLGNYTNYGLASCIADRGYVNDKSCMLIAAGLDAVIYNNIFSDKLSVKDPPLLTDEPQELTDIPIYRMYVKKSKSTTQMLYDYQHEVEQQTLEDQSYIVDKASFRKDYSEILPIHEEFYEAVGLVRSEVYPIDLGNASNNEMKAFYNNRKRKSQFLDTAQCFSNGFTRLSLLDDVRCSYNGTNIRGIIVNIITTFDGIGNGIYTRNDITSTNINMRAE